MIYRFIAEHRAALRAKRKQRYKVTTKRYPSREPAPNLLVQDFNAEAVNEQ